MTYFNTDLTDFVCESNHIEGLSYGILDHEIDAHAEFLALDVVRVSDLKTLVTRLEPGSVLRDRHGLDVTVGNHIPPPGGPLVQPALEGLLEQANDLEKEHHPYIVHKAYETLHPFTDCNGRSGRALWAWMMLKQERWPALRLGFLHAWYYQSLDNGR